MRINTVDKRYIMIKSDEISNLLLDLQKIQSEDGSEHKKALEYMLNLYKLIKDYFFKNHYVPTEVAVRSDLDVTKSFLKNIDDEMTLRDIHNSFMYAVMKNDISKTNILYEFVRQHSIKTYSEVEDVYGKEISDYIRENKDYDYIDNVNRVNRKDSSILLFDGERLEMKSLIDTEIVLQMKN